MTLRVGSVRYNEFGLLYFPIVRDGALGEIVGTAYDRETADLFAAAGDLRAIAERLLATVQQVEDVLYPGASIDLSDEEVKSLKIAVDKAKGVRM